MTSREAKKRVCRAVRRLLQDRYGSLENEFVWLLGRDADGCRLSEKDQWRMDNAFNELLDEMYRRGGVD